MAGNCACTPVCSTPDFVLRRDMRRGGLQILQRASRSILDRPIKVSAPQQLVSLADFLPLRCGASGQLISTSAGRCTLGRQHLVQSSSFCMNQDNAASLLPRVAQTAGRLPKGQHCALQLAGLRRACTRAQASSASELRRKACTAPAALLLGQRQLGACGFATRAPRQHAGGWRNSPTEQALYLVGHTFQSLLVLSLHGSCPTP